MFGLSVDEAAEQALNERFDQRLGGVERTMLNIQMAMDGIMERLPPARPVGGGRYAEVNNLGGHLPLAADVLATPAAPAVRMHHRRLDSSSLVKMTADISLADFRSWRNNWNDFCQLNQIDNYTRQEQAAAFRMALDPSMQQTLEIGLNVLPDAAHTPDEILDGIAVYIRSKRNVALDRVAFDECRQLATETFDQFYIRLRRLSISAELCGNCYDQRIATRIIVGIRDDESKKKLLALVPFPTVLVAVNLCRSEESARSGERSLGEASKVSSIQSQSNRRPDRPANVSKPSCGKCGRFAHATGVICPAIAGSCHLCNAIGHFSPCCPKKTATTAAKPAAASASVKPADPTVKLSERRVVVSAKIAVVSSATARSAPVISVDVYDMRSKDFIATIDSAIPDGGAEVTVAGLDVLKALGLSEHDLRSSRYELVQASRSSPLLSIGQRKFTFEYGPRKANFPIVFCPEVDGMLISWMDCIALGILSTNYPKPLPLDNDMQSDGTVRAVVFEPEPVLTVQPLKTPRFSSAPSDRSTELKMSLKSKILSNVNSLPEAPNAEQIETIKKEIVKEFEDVFNQSDPLCFMNGPPMQIELEDG